MALKSAGSIMTTMSRTVLLICGVGVRVVGCWVWAVESHNLRVRGRASCKVMGPRQSAGVVYLFGRSFDRHFKRARFSDVQRQA